MMLCRVGRAGGGGTGAGGTPGAGGGCRVQAIRIATRPGAISRANEGQGIRWVNTGLDWFRADWYWFGWDRAGKGPSCANAGPLTELILCNGQHQTSY